MPKVLRIINRFNIGGPTYNATFLTRFLDDDFETLLIGGLPEKDEADSLHIPQEYGVEPMILKEMKRIPDFKSDREAYRKIKDIIREFKPDIVHTHASKAGALGRKAAFACKVPVVVHTFHGHVFHSYFGKLKTFVYKFIERRLASKSSGIIAISDIQKKELTEIHKICSPEKVRVIPLGFDLTKFNSKIATHRQEVRDKYNITENEIAIAIIGRLTAIKNHAFFFQVAEKVMEQSKRPVKFFIVGDGDMRDFVTARTKELNERFGEKIFMTSWIKDIATFNAGMDIICLTSDNEGTPVSLIEAQASEVAVITTETGGVRDIMLDGETGFIVQKGDLKEYTKKLVFLIENDEIRRKMSQNGWTYVKDKFHYTRLVRDMEIFYRELLAKTTK
ncbi:MAG: glycosyl transferase group 1 [Crocinitomicaceae bacterium]|jgi:glycosyltransferase involved in cell wall biosynthesis|nr:glycosyl transferase group 1 [Crocinitomicaceae bacterium]